MKRVVLVWYNIEEDELGMSGFLDSLFYSLEIGMIPDNYILIGEL